MDELLGWAKPSTPVLSEMEARLLRAWRGAEEAARRMALDMLESHPQEQEGARRA